MCPRIAYQRHCVPSLLKSVTSVKWISTCSPHQICNFCISSKSMFQKRMRASAAGSDGPQASQAFMFIQMCASINFLINARRPSSYHFHTSTISQYFPHIILLPFSYPHIILNINLISFPQRQHFSKSSSSTTHSQICIGPKAD